MLFESSYGEIYYEIEGDGIPLLMIHGTPFSSRVWNNIKKQIQNKFKIYTYDLLGYGKSEKAEDVSLGVQNKILCELLDYWNLYNPNVIAHDFGGATLLRSIILNKRQYNKMMLIDVVALSPWGSPFVQHVKKYENVFNEIPDYIHSAIVEAYIKDAIYTDISREDIEFLIEPWLGQRGKKAFYKQISQMDERFTKEVEREYINIDIPTRILWGKNDNWIPIIKGKELHDKIKNSEFISIPDCNHLVQYDKPGRIVSEINEFF